MNTNYSVYPAIQNPGSQPQSIKGFKAQLINLSPSRKTYRTPTIIKKDPKPIKKINSESKELTGPYLGSGKQPKRLFDLLDAKLCTSLIIKSDDFYSNRIAHMNNVFDAINMLVRNFTDMNHTIFGKAKLNKYTG